MPSSSDEAFDWLTGFPPERQSKGARGDNLTADNGQADGTVRGLISPRAAMRACGAHTVLIQRGTGGAATECNLKGLLQFMAQPGVQPQPRSVLPWTLASRLDCP